MSQSSLLHIFPNATSSSASSSFVPSTGSGSDNESTTTHHQESTMSRECAESRSIDPPKAPSNSTLVSTDPADGNGNNSV